MKDRAATSFDGVGGAGELREEVALAVVASLVQCVVWGKDGRSGVR